MDLQDDSNERGKALMHLLDKVDEQQDGIEFNDQMQLAGVMTKARDEMNTFDTGIDKNRIMARARGTGVSALSFLTFPQLSTVKNGQPAPNLTKPSQVATSLKKGQMVIANRYDRVNREEKIRFGTFVELANKIVTIKTRSGKLLYLFNTDQYEWVVRPVDKLPDFPDSFNE